LVRPGEVACPTCGVGNDPERSFCRKCGTSMTAEPTTTAKKSWWKKLITKEEKKKKKVHAAGERPMRDKKGRR
jgi:hypothetical protein